MKVIINNDLGYEIGYLVGMNLSFDSFKNNKEKKYLFRMDNASRYQDRESVEENLCDDTIYFFIDDYDGNQDDFISLVRAKFCIELSIKDDENSENKIFFLKYGMQEEFYKFFDNLNIRLYAFNKNYSDKNSEIYPEFLSNFLVKGAEYLLYVANYLNNFAQNINHNSFITIKSLMSNTGLNI